jgi:hypothetical protein
VFCTDHKPRVKFHKEQTKRIKITERKKNNQPSEQKKGEILQGFTNLKSGLEMKVQQRGQGGMQNA